MSRDVTLAVEHTPNPNTIKILLGASWVEVSGADFCDAQHARAGSPLAARLFGLDGVRRVFLGEDFVSVTKEESVAWRHLAPGLMDEIRRHVRSGEAWMNPGFRPEMAEVSPGEPGDDAETIRRIIETEVRPAVARDGGDVRFVSYCAEVLELEMHGACAGCPSSAETLRLGIETRLREAVPGIREIIARDS